MAYPQVFGFFFLHAALATKYFTYGPCCESSKTKALLTQENCDLNFMYRPLQYCDNRHGSGIVECSEDSKVGSNTDEWINDAYISALAVKYGKKTAGDYLAENFKGKASSVIGTHEKITTMTSEELYESKTVSNSYPTPPYTINRIFETVHTCGEIEMVPESGRFLVSFTSTSYCTATDYWEYLGKSKDCDNRSEKSNKKNCNLKFEYGVKLSNFPDTRKVPLLHLKFTDILQGLDDNFLQSLSPSNITQQYWSEMHPNVWDDIRSARVTLTSPPLYSIKSYQLVGVCTGELMNYTIYTNVIKRVRIPSLLYCKPEEHGLHIGEYHIPKDQGTDAANNYMYYLHPIGIDFPTRPQFFSRGPDDDKYIAIIRSFDEFKNQVREKFKNTKLINSEIWKTYARIPPVTCPWNFTDECPDKELERIESVTTNSRYTAHQLYGVCGEVTLYTWTIVKKNNGTILPKK